MFFGHGLGALLAYETARALKAKYDWSPIMLFSSGSNGPTSRCVNAPDAYMRQARLSPPLDPSGRSCSPPISQGRLYPGLGKQLPLHLLPDHELAEALCLSNRVPRHFKCNALMLRAMLGTIRADVAAEETYRHEATPPPVRMRGEMSFVTADAHGGTGGRGGNIGGADMAGRAMSAVDGGHGSYAAAEHGEHGAPEESPYLQQQHRSSSLHDGPQAAVKLTCDIVAYAGMQVRRASVARGHEPKRVLRGARALSTPPPIHPLPHRVYKLICPPSRARAHRTRRWQTTRSRRGRTLPAAR